MKKEKATPPKPMKLVTILAKACMFAQEHIDDKQAWPIDAHNRTAYLQCVSFQMACFLAQNTKDGEQGVDWSVVLIPLIKHPMKTEKQWERILNKAAYLYGGWKQ